MRAGVVLLLFPVVVNSIKCTVNVPSSNGSQAMGPCRSVSGFCAKLQGAQASAPPKTMQVCDGISVDGNAPFQCTREQCLIVDEQLNAIGRFEQTRFNSLLLLMYLKSAQALIYASS